MDFAMPELFETAFVHGARIAVAVFPLAAFNSGNELLRPFQGAPAAGCGVTGGQRRQIVTAGMSGNIPRFPAAVWRRGRKVRLRIPGGKQPFRVQEFKQVATVGFLAHLQYSRVQPDLCE